MRTLRGRMLVSTALVAVLVHAGAASAQLARFEGLSGLPFAENRPTPETARTLRDELLFQRATQTYLWALPLINTLGMKVGSEKVFGAGYDILPVWKKRLDAKTLVTTPCSDVIYAMDYVDLGTAGKERNWLATVPGRGYFAVLRLDGPTEAAIDKSWEPGDIEKVR